MSDTFGILLVFFLEMVAGAAVAYGLMWWLVPASWWSAHALCWCAC
jgi:hypothetical protein